VSSEERSHEGESVLVRHAETEWSLAGRHTGRTDLALTERGRSRARALADHLAARRFELVLVSPARRARETCELCGLGERASVREELREWDYGEYEGLTTVEIRARRPGWRLFRDGAAGGEPLASLAARAERVMARIRAVDGDVLVFAHGHVLRVLTARWLELDAAAAERFVLDAAALGVIGYDRDVPALLCWNVRAL